jgi:nitrate reductase gamma subunit
VLHRADLLLHRRLFDPRIRLTSHRTDIAILVILWVQLVIGLSTLPASLHHVSDPQTMLRLAEYLQGIVLMQPNAALVAGVEWHFQAHMLLGMTIFLLFPFSRLVHVWSGFGTAGLPGAPVPDGACPPAQRAGRPEPAAPRRLITRCPTSESPVP